MHSIFLAWHRMATRTRPSSQNSRSKRKPPPPPASGVHSYHVRKTRCRRVRICTSEAGSCRRRTGCLAPGLEAPGTPGGPSAESGRQQGRKLVPAGQACKPHNERDEWIRARPPRAAPRERRVVRRPLPALPSATRDLSGPEGQSATAQRGLWRCSTRHQVRESKRGSASQFRP